MAEENSIQNEEISEDVATLPETVNGLETSSETDKHSNKSSESLYRCNHVATDSHPLIENYKSKHKEGTETSEQSVDCKDTELNNVSQSELSDNETEKSIYEAHLSSNYQNVALTMNEKEGNLNFLAYGKKSNKLRKVKVMPIELSMDSDLSSLESSPDSTKSDVFSETNELEETNTQGGNGGGLFDAIVPLSEEEERKHSRNWQKIVLPDGEKRSIDMRVIEPYKRVLSHGGYLRTGGQTAIILFSACFLPDKSRCDYDYVMDNLFLYVLWTLDRLITEDYVLIYMNGGATRLPSFNWLKRCYQLVGRKLRKNLCHMYFVHPTLWIKTMLFMAKPFISSKFFKKISFVPNLKELKGRVPLELTAIPDKVKAYDTLHFGT